MMSVLRRLPGGAAALALAFAAAAAHAQADHALEQCVVMPQPAKAGAPAKASVLAAGDVGNVTVMQIDGDYGRDETAARQAVAERFYAEHPDEYDFLIAFTTFEFDTGDATAFYNAIKNDVVGTGDALYDYSGSFGSAGRLQGYVDMAATSRYELRPRDARHEQALNVLAHELMHRWGARLRYRDAGGADSDALLGSERAHWSYFLDSDASVMYGNDWRRRDDGRYESVAISARYNSLDLYAAGFVAPGDVAPVTLIRNGDGAATAFPQLGAVSGGQPETITIEQIVTANGARVPAAADAPKDFRAALILLTRPGEHVPPELLYLLETFRTRFQQRFAQMTDGRARVRIFTQRTDAAAPALPTILAGSGDTATAPGNAAAVAWLEGRQAADGHWHDRPATALRDTVAALRALETLAPTSPAIARARAWIAARTVAGNDQRAWQFLATGDAAQRDALTAAQSPDGGWGLAAGLQASPFDTAIVGDLFARHAPDSTVVDAALQNLVPQQNADGSFGATAGGRGRLLPTLHATRLLHASAQTSHRDAAARAGTWLDARRLGNGYGQAQRVSLADTIELYSLVGELPLAADGATGARAFVRERQQIAGDWGGSVYLTATALLASARDQRVNFTAAGAIVATPSAPTDGARVALAVYATNAGNAAAPASVARWYDGDPDQGGAQIGSDAAVPALVPGARHLIQATWDTTGRAGAHTIQLVLDADQAVPELREDDNRATLALTIGAAPAQPDLQLLDVELALDPAAVAELPAAVRARGIVRNLGLTAAVGARVTVHAASAPTTILAETTLDVPPRGSAPLDLAFTVTHADALAIVLRADPDDRIAEAREDNNEARLALAFGPSIDLAVASGDLAVDGAAVAGHDVALRVDVHNRGTLATPPAVLRVEVVQNGTTTTVLDEAVQIAAGATARRQLAWRAPAPGVAQLRVVLDPAGQIAEAREDNNAAQLDFAVGSADRPDLAAVAATLEFTPTPARQSESVVASLRVRNLGADLATPFAVGVYSADPRLGAPRIGTATVPGLAAASETTVAIDVPVLDAYGTPNMHVLVDADDAIAELDEGNNLAIKPLEVLSLPDVAVSVAGIVLTPALPVAGEAVTARVSVRNLGQQDAQNVVVRLAEGDTAASTPVDDKTIATLPAGGNVELVWNWTFGRQADARAVTVIADPADTVRELTDENNRATLPVDVQNGNLFASERYISPNGDGVRDEAAIVFRFAAPGTARVRIVNGLGHVMRRFDDVASNGDGRGQIVWDGRDAYGRIVVDGDYRVIVADADGRPHGELTVTVDNNRSSVLEAVGTRHALANEIGYGVDFLADRNGIPSAASPYTGYLYGEHSAVLPVGSGNQYVTGLYRGRTLALPQVEPIVSLQWAAQNSASVDDFWLSPGGREVAFTLHRPQGTSGTLHRTAADGSGAIVPLLAGRSGLRAYGYIGEHELLITEHGRSDVELLDTRDGSVRPFRRPPAPAPDVWFETTRTGAIMLASGGEVAFVPRDDARPIVEFIRPPFPQHGAYRTRLNHDRTRALVYTMTTGPDATEHGVVEHVNLDTGARRTVYEHDKANVVLPDLFDDQVLGVAEVGFAWIRARNEFFIVDGRARRLLRFNAAGILLADVALPQVGRAGAYIGAEIVATFTTAEPASEYGCVERGQRRDEEHYYDASSSTLYLELNEVAVEPDVPVLLQRSEQPQGWSPYVPKYLDGITQLVRVDVDTGAVETVREVTQLDLELPADRSRYARIGSSCRERYTPEWPDQLLGDGARVTYGGDVLTPSRGLFEQPADTRLLAGLLPWPDESRALDADKVVTSLLNGYALIDARSVGGAFELTGVAADRNFAYYELDYALATQPGVWHALTPASPYEVRLDEFLTWAPPQAGSYIVRLRVVDRAGNATTATTTVNATRGADIDGFGVAPRFFSPNGDGAQDIAELRFRVRQPASLSLIVENPAGAVVYRAEHSYGSADLGPHRLTWDGRDDGGARVPDGRYRIKFGGFAAWVVVDTVAPALTAQLLDAYRRENGAVYAVPELELAATDANTALLSVDAVSAIDGGTTTLFAGEMLPKPRLPVPSSIYATSSYRVTATDPAGNRTARSLARGEERLVLYAYLEADEPLPKVPPFQPLPLADAAPTVSMMPIRLDEDGDELPLYVFPAMAGLEAVAIQAAPIDDPANWIETRRIPLAQLYCGHSGECAADPDRGGTVQLTSQGLARGKTYRVRLVGERGDGTRLASNHVVVRHGGIAPAVCGDRGTITVPEYTAGRLREAILHYRQDGGSGLTGTLPASRIDEDSATFEFWPAEEGDYDLTIHAVDAAGFRHVSSARRCPAGEPPPGGGGAYGFEIKVAPVVQDRCDGTPSGALRVQHVPARGGFGPPARLRWRYDNGATLGEVVTTPIPFSPPASAPPFDVDTRGWSEGSYRIALDGEYVAANGQAQWRELASASLPVELAPPDVAIMQPDDGARVCAAQLDGALVGSVVSPSQVAYRVSLGAGAAPSAWRCFHDAGAEFAGGSLCADLAAVAKISGSSLVNRPLWSQIDPQGRDALRLYDGAASLQVKAYNWSGGTVCATTTIRLDSGVEIAERAPPQRQWPVAGRETIVIAPGSGGDYARGRILLHAAESVGIVARVHHANSAAVATLLDVADTVGDVDIEWDGLVDGAPVDDGRYEVRIVARDACGQTKTLNYPLLVKRAPPNLAFAAPQAGAVIGASVLNVYGIVDDALLLEWSLDVAVAASPGNRQTIATGNRPMPAVDGVAPALGSWSRGQAAGPIELRLRASDVFGNVAAITLPLVLDAPSRMIATAGASPALFSPNADGALDTTRIEIGLLRAANLVVRVRNAAAQDVATLFQGAGLAGTQGFAWDGRAGNAALPDGDYSVAVEATDAGGTLPPELARVPVTLDTAAPSIALTAPNGGFIRPDQTIEFTVADPRLAAYEATLARGGTIVASAQGAVSGVGGLVVPADAAEGAYALKIAARDAAGNRAERTFDLTLDRTPPVLALLAPADAAVVAANAVTTVRGTVNDAHIASYTLDVAPANGGTWQTLAGGDVNVDAATLVAWTPNRPDGSYRLRLSAVDRAGNAHDVVHTIAVDGTAPTAQIASPLDDAYVKPALDVTGTATDAHFAEYRLSLIRASALPDGQWSDVYVGTEPIDGARLANLNLPTLAGDYVLRLTVTDRAGLSATDDVRVRVDDEPPPAPTRLTGRVENQRDAILAWLPVVVDDLAGYHVYRNGARITALPITAARYVDADAPEGRPRYHVVAIDRAGNESAHSNTVELVVDRTPPRVALTRPAAGERVRGTQDIIGVAHSSDDFLEYRVTVEPLEPAGAVRELARSSLPVEQGVLAAWNTLDFADETRIRIALAAEDRNGNRATAQVDVTVDNGPPAAPTGVLASLATTPGAPCAALGGDENDVRVCWDANAEADLLGYLVYRDGRLVDAPNPAPPDLRPFAQPDLAWLDLDVADGAHVYVVHAIDRAGNISEPSVPAALDPINLGPPDLDIVRPLPNAAFEHDIDIFATSDHRDIAHVQFAYRRAGAFVWTDIGSAATAEPYRAQWTPGALPYGEYDLRAIATDESGQQDPTPPVVRVRYADLTAPAAPAGLVARADGDTVVLTWNAVDASDLAGYRVAVADGGHWQTLTSTPMTATRFEHVGREDGEWRYRVVAVDTSDNDSTPSNVATAHVFGLELAQPFTPTTDSNVAIEGRSARTGTLNVRVENADGAIDLPPVALDAGGRIALAAEPVAPGANRFTLRVTDADGNVSRPASVLVERGRVPAVPTGLAAVVVDHRVDVSWNANAETDIAGYRLFRRGSPVEADRSLAGSVTASAGIGSAGNAVDGDLQTAWDFQTGFGTDIDDPDDPALTLDLGAPRLVGAVNLTWASLDRASHNVDLQARAGDAWVTVARLRGSTSIAPSLVPATAYRTAALRVVVHGDGVAASRRFALAEADVFERPLIDATTLSQTLPDGRYDYRVSAVGTLGFESARSPEVYADVGDALPPDAVVLTGRAVGVDAELEWTASASSDVARYELRRNDVAIANVPVASPRAWRDAGLPNGTHRYVVVAVDAFDNASAPSNVVTLTIAGNGPGVPQQLAVTAPPAGSMLDLAWLAGSGATPASYVVRRATAAAGPFVEIARVAATAHRDAPLVNGTTYWYTVEAIDAYGNAGGQSAPASGTPRRTLAPPPPLLTYPTVAGEPLVTAADALPVCGYAEPGSTVAVDRDGVTVATASAAAVPLRDTALSDGGDVHYTFAPDGLHYAWSAFGGTIRYARRGGAAVEATRTGELAQWAPRGLALYYRDAANGAIERVEPGRPARSLGIAIDALYNFAISPDETHIAFTGDYTVGGTTQTGLWLAGVDGANARRVADVDGSSLGTVLRYAPDGRYVLLATHDATIVVDARTATVARRIDAPTSADPAWLPDGRFVYVATDAGDDVVYVYDPVHGTTRELTRTTGLYEIASSPDGALVLFVRNDAIELRSTVDGRVVGTVDVSPDARFGAWTASGRIAFDQWDELLWITPPGWFCTDPVALVAPRHVFGAVARDAAGNTSLPAAAIVVTRAAATLPDLAVGASDVFFLPADAAPGDRVAALVNVRNVGAARAPATVLRAELSVPNGAPRVFTPSVAALDSGASVALNIDLGTLAAAGTYRLRVTLDPAGAVAEASEANNQAEASLTLNAAGAPTLEVVPDRALFAPGEPVTGSVAVANLDVAARVRMTAIDAAGAVVDELGEYTVGPLARGARWTHAVTWPADGVFAGDYRLRARLVGAGGALLAERHGAVTIAAVQHVALRVEPEASLVVAGTTLRVRSAVDYADGNAPIDGARLRLVAVTPAGAERLVAEQTLGTLLPGYALNKDDAWNTAGLAAGTYGLRLRLTAPGLDRSVETSVTIDDPAARVVLAGTLALAPADALVAGHGGELRYALQNRGDTMLTGVDARVRVTAAGSSTVVAQAERRVDLAPGANDDALLVLTAPPLALTAHAAVLEARLPDDAAGVWRVLARRSFGVVDALAPEIVVATPAAGVLQPAVAPLRVGVVDAHSTVALAQVRVDGGAWQPLTRGEDGWYARGLAGLADGSHRLVVRARDSWGNEAVSAERAFDVDATVPVITITGVADGDVATQPVVPQIAIVDANLDATDIRLNGAAFASGTTIAADGDYVLAVRATDRAGNVAQRTVRFRVDRTAPAVAIVAPADGAVVAQSTIDAVVQTETGATATLNVGAWQAQAVAGADGRASFANVPLALGDNTLEARARDTAGNIGGPATARVRYEPNAGAGLVGSLQPALAALPHGEPLSISVTAENTGASPLPAQRLRVRVAAATVLGETIVTHDFAAGETYTTSVEFASAGWALARVTVTLEHERGGTWTELDREHVDVVDRTAPTLVALAPADGDVVRGPAAIRARATDALSAIDVVEARIDEQAWFALAAATPPGDYAGAAPALADGAYRYALRARDTAGNVATAGPVVFAIDATAPTIVIAGVADGDLVAQPVTPTITITDAHPATQTITLNDAPYVSGTTLTASGSYVLAVAATDRADNRAEARVAFTIDRDAPAVAITSPADGATVATATVAIAGTTEPLAQVDVDVGTFSASVFADASGAFDVAGATLQAGSNAIRAQATDRAGNVGAATTIHVTYEPPAPSALTGTLGTLPSYVLRGTPLRVTHAVQNPGTTAASNVPVRVVLRTGGSDVDADTFTVTLAPQASQSGSSAFDTSALAPAQYDVVLEAWQAASGGAPAWAVLDTGAVAVFATCGAPDAKPGDRVFVDGFEGRPDLIWCDGFEALPKARTDPASSPGPAPWLAFRREYALAPRALPTGWMRPGALQ